MRSLLLTGTVSGFIWFNTACLLGQQIDSTTVADTPPAQESQTATAKHPGNRLFHNAHVTGGQLTLPFKIRKHSANHTFRLTTDVTLGGYIGYTRKLSEKRNFSLTVPLTAGLTFINLNDNNTAVKMVDVADAEVVPGLTWSTGIILQLEQYNIGLMLGKDYASDVGNQWQYHGKLWWSFGIGFVFLQ